MVHTLEELKQAEVFRNFYQICQIPHGSGNEKPLSDYIVNWAGQLGLRAVQDANYNVLIRKPASPGFEQAPAVMLQAHLDMVCEKADGIQHDFMKDPIHWVVEGDELSTGGRTTLGADDGIGVALAMSVLEDKELRHPPLEVLFTVMEEEDLSGAERFDTSAMKASYLINLDHVCDREILCGSCGGMEADVQIPVTSEAPPAGWTAYRLSVSGLKGGHSGEDIHRGRGNANIFLARLLLALESSGEFRLGEIKGGSFRLAIPREASAVVWMDPKQANDAQSVLRDMEKKFRRELALTADNVAVTLEPAQAEPWCVEPGKVIDAMILMPDGIAQMNEALTGLVDTSDNLGEVYLDGHTLHMVTEIRSAQESLRDYLFQKMEHLAARFQGSCSWSSAYPSWTFCPNSKLRKLCDQVYFQDHGEHPEFLTVHAGLEVGHFFKGRPDLDAVAIGPNCRDFHSPSETLSISSVEKSFTFLCHILERIHR